MTANNLNFGYNFEPDCSPDHPAHTRLRVVLRAAPTHAHYDPEHVTLPIINPGREIEPLRVFHPWPVEGAYRAAAGRAILTDRLGKKVEAFTFGGALRLQLGPDYVLLHLESPAPILALQFPGSVSDYLASAVEGLLAQRRAALDMAGQPQRFETRLAQLAPEEFYQACLHSLHQRLSAPYAALAERQLAPFVSRALRPGARPLEELL